MRVRLIVYSDYLCPWCYNASVRLRAVQAELGGRVALDWRSFLLRPRPRGARSLERFRAYTRSWMRPAAEEDAGAFKTWQGDAGPPSHSVPPHLVAKAAARLGTPAFERVHDGLLHAYFHESRDVTDTETLRDIWREAGLPPGAFAGREDPVLRDAVLAEHAEALELGVTGVPAARLDGQEAFLLGAQPRAVYARWLRRALGEDPT